jgi:hypothetical protein
MSQALLSAWRFLAPADDTKMAPKRAIYILALYINCTNLQYFRGSGAGILSTGMYGIGAWWQR